MAAGRRRGALLAERRDGQQIAEEPDPKLMDEVEVMVARPSDSGVVTFAFAVVFAAGHVNCQCAEKTGDAVSGVKVKPEVADL